MSKCNCIYEDFCTKINGSDIVLPQPCEYRKDKTNFVEVVRCKDCIYAHMTIGKEEVKYCDMFDSDGGVYFDKNHYCSYGERKKT